VQEIMFVYYCYPMMYFTPSIKLPLTCNRPDRVTLSPGDVSALTFSLESTQLPFGWPFSFQNSSIQSFICVTICWCCFLSSGLALPLAIPRSGQCEPLRTTKTGASGVEANGPPGRCLLETDAARQGSNSL
jgi:hypothetical protein